MSKFLDLARVQTATHKPIHLPLNCRHMTTTDFFQFNIPYIRRMIPGESIDVEVSTFARLAGMPLPTFGDANLNLRAFFVPYRMVFPAWNDFITDTPHATADGQRRTFDRVPYFTNRMLVSALQISTFSRVVADDSLPYDFSVRSVDENGSVYTYHKFTAEGRILYKILRQLGYKPNFDLHGDSWNGTSFSPTFSQPLSALDILCWVKVFVDYYFPAQYYGLEDRAFLDGLCKRDTLENFVLDVDVLRRLFRLCILVYYASDYFTAAFDTPVGPNSDSASSVTIYDVSAKGSSQVLSETDATETYINVPYSNASELGTPLTQYAITALRRLTDYMKRHQLAGARSIDRLLARFGMKTSNDASMRCYYLGSHHVPLVVADVMSTADTLNADTESGVALGDYAGKGFLTGKNGHFDFKNNSTDFGLFMICSSLIPNIGYYEGYDKQTTSVNRLDFYTPEFDGLGTRVLEKGELCLPTDPFGWQNGEILPRTAFGFTPQYSEYKVARDRLTGDFDIDSINDEGFTSQSWHLFRNVGNYVDDKDYTQLVHNRDFVRATDWKQYLRIFYDQSSDADHFVVNYLFKVDVVAPVKPLFDTYDFEHDEGKQIDIEVNGKRLN